MSLSDGVTYPRVLRGRLPRLWAMRARSAAECTHRSVPLGRLLAQQPVGVLVGPSLPGLVRVAEVDPDAGGDGESAW
jgi:hypothetical protein